MKFRKGISMEIQRMLMAQLEEYEQNMQMNKVERKELHAWVANGHSPYDNGDYIYGEDGCPMDFISASRLAEEQIQWFDSLTEEDQKSRLQKIRYGYDVQLDTPFIYADSPVCPFAEDDDVPF